MAQTLKERCQYFMAAAAGDQESELSNFDAKSVVEGDIKVQIDRRIFR